MIGLPKFYQLSRDPVGTLAREHALRGDAFALSLGVRRLAVFSHPDYAQYILQTNRSNYVKSSRTATPLSKLLGNGLVTQTGLAWRERRRQMQPIFAQASVAAMQADLVATADAALDRWLRLPTNALDAPKTALFDTLAAELAASATFGAVFSPAEIRSFAARLATIYNHTTAKTVAGLMRLPASPLRRSNRMHDWARQEIARFVQQAQCASEPRGLLAMWLQRHPELPMHAIQDEAMTLFVSGYKTVASCLLWSAYLLAHHPNIAEQTRASLAVASLDEALWLPLLDAVVRESLRLYPPSWRLTRVAVEADEIAGLAIEQGTSVLVSVYNIHRHPALWPQPEQFCPERFGGQTPSHAWLPFGAGPRHCIGSALALQQIKLVLAGLLRRFDLLPHESRLTYQSSITLAPTKRLPVVLSRR